MQSKAATVDQYLAELPDDRRQAISAIRQVILDNLDEGFTEGMQYGMIGYFVPHSLYPAGYHCDPKQPLPFAGLASQKNHMALYLMCIYGSSAAEKAFRDDWAKSGKKLDMGKSCIRFKRLEDVALDVIARAIGRITAKGYISAVEAQLSSLAAAKTKAKAEKSTAKPKQPPAKAHKPTAKAKKTATKTKKAAAKRKT